MSDAERIKRAAEQLRFVRRLLDGGSRRDQRAVAGIDAVIETLAGEPHAILSR